MHPAHKLIRLITAKPHKYWQIKPLILKYERLFSAISYLRLMTFPPFFPKLYHKGDVVQMRAIRKWRSGYAVLFAVGVFLTACFAVKLMTKTMFVFGAASIALLMLLVRQSRLLYDANLIWENRILAVPSAVISISGGKGKRGAEETVVSTFGILIGSKIYKWGCDGVHGVRLSAIEIDRARIYLTFGDGAETMQVELLHGMDDEQAVMDVKQRLWHETGVAARISGW
jgi:hypothetical protein